MANSEDVLRLRVCDEDGEVYFASHPRIREQFDALAAALREAREEVERLKRPTGLLVAAAIAHRGCCGSENDPTSGKIHGYCVVCGVPWPCATASAFINAAMGGEKLDGE